MINLYRKLWSPREYLTHYYSTSKVTEDERHIFKFIIDFFKTQKIYFNEILEIGCGPTIHHVLPFAYHVKRIFMADYLGENLTEIKNWVSGSKDAHNWKHYINGFLRLKKLSEPSSYKKRTHEFRKKLTSLLLCNIFNRHPLLDKSLNRKTFSLVTSFYCLECVTYSKKQWEKSMKNISSLVSKNGWIIMSALRDTDHYLFSDKKFPAVRINEKDIYCSLIDNNFNPNTIKIEVYKVNMKIPAGFHSIIIYCAQRI